MAAGLSVKGAFLAAATLLLAAGCAPVEPPASCRTGFDIGSSGIRVGSTAGTPERQVSIDYLADVWAGGRIARTAEPTAKALRDLKGDERCQAAAGAYSAWRLAAERGGAGPLADTLAELKRKSGVAILVIPQTVEGAYGYHAARLQLGEALTSPFILDIGGGSLQFASRDKGWGTALGQKAWRRLFCAEVKGSADPECSPNPVGDEARTRSRQILAGLVADARSTLGTGIGVTAVSSPVVRGIHPILRHLAAHRPDLAGHVDSQGFDLAALDLAIGLFAGMDDNALRAHLNDCRDDGGQQICRPAFLGSVVTDMLLLDALMSGLGVERLNVAQANLTNVPGLLADDRAFAWADRHECYLDRLRQSGVDAFLSDPATCPP